MLSIDVIDFKEIIYFAEHNGFSQALNGTVSVLFCFVPSLTNQII